MPEIEIINNRIVFSPRINYSPAIEAGLQSGDVITTINKIPITTVQSFIKTVKGIKTFDPVDIKIIRENKQLIRYIKPKLALLTLDWIFTFILGCLLAIVGFIILFNENNSIYYIFAVALFLYLLSITVRAFYLLNIMTLIIVLIGNSSVFLLPVFTLYYPMTWCSKKIRSGIIVVLLLFFILYLSLGCFYYLKGISGDSNLWFFHFNTLEKCKYIIDIIAVFLFFIPLLYSYRKSSTAEVRNQIEWIVTGFILAFSPYFFFEYLPFLVENLLNERISLGNFGHIFISIFPIFFLIGLSKYNRQKYNYIIPRYIYYLITIPLFLFIFLLITPSIHSYLASQYGFSPDTAYLFTAFLYLLIMQPILISGVNIVDTFIIKRKFKYSLYSLSTIESENILLKERMKLQEQRSSMDTQTPLFKDMAVIINEIVSIITKAARKTAISLTDIQHKINTMGVMLQKSQCIDHIKIEEINTDIHKHINTISLENIRIKEMIGSIHHNYNIKPSLPVWIGCDYILRKAIKSVLSQYPDCIFDTEAVKDYYFYCCPSHIIHGFVHLFSFVADTLNSTGTEIIIRTNREKSIVMIEIEYRNTIFQNNDINTMFLPRIYHNQESGYKGLGLYITKVLFEQNNGKIAAGLVNNKIHFIIQFLSEKKI